MFKDDYKNYKQYAIDLLSKLISYNTVLDEYNPNSDAPFGKGNKDALEYLLSSAQKDGFTVYNDKGYAGHIEFGSGDQILGVLAHLDVVPVKIEEWDTNPFELVIKDDKFYARGSLDDKGPLVASYIALKMLADSGFVPNKKIRLIAGCDEETGSRCLEHYFESMPKPDLGFSPDASFPLINGEKGITSYDLYLDKDDVIKSFEAGIRYNMVPSEAKMELNIDLENEYIDYLKKNNYKGKVENKIYTAYGVAAHAMCPDQGVNACFILFDFLNKYTNSKIAKFIDKYYLNDVYGKKAGYDYYDEDMKELTSNLAIVKTLDDKLMIGVNIRYPKDECYDNMKLALAKITAEFGYSFVMHPANPVHYVDKSSTLVKTLMEAYQKVTGDLENGPITIGGGTYAREMSNAVAFGPVFVGREDVCHIANEYMYISDFDSAVEIYYEAMKNLCK